MMSQKGSIMTQIHKKFTGEQIKILFNAYEAGHLSRDEIERTVGIGKTRFFALLKHYREDPNSFSIQYQRSSPMGLSAEVEEKIRVELQREKALLRRVITTSRLHFSAARIITRAQVSRVIAFFRALVFHPLECHLVSVQDW